MAPIFIIGTERSGTNLLRLMLNAHPHIAVPHPPHIMKLLGPLEHRYGDLTDDGNFRRLIAAACRLVELHTYPWEIRPDRERVFREARDRNLLCIYFALYDQYLASTDKERWCCKSTFMIERVGEILRYHPAARFIFMVRDGRDVAVSAKESIFNHFHVFYSARRWQREQRLGLSWLTQLGPEQVFLLRYETLLANPEATVRRLCDFLGEEFRPEMLEYYRSGEARKSGSLSISWQNTAKPVLTANTAKFHRCLRPDEILLFEAIAGEALAELGYELLNAPALQADQRAALLQERFCYRLSEIGLKLKAEVRHLLKDRNSLARLRKNLYVATLRIWPRLLSHA
jgi:hypothetical protein